MQISVVQEFPHPAGMVVVAFADPDLYPKFGALGDLSPPKIISHNIVGRTVTIEVRYAYVGSFPSAASAFVDADKLTFVERSTYNLDDGSGTFSITPDHYDTLLAASGTTHVVDGSPTRRHIDGDLRVDLGWAGRMFKGNVESAIAQGVTRAMEAQAEIVTRHLGG